MQASRQWREIFKVLKEKKYRILYQAKLSFKSEGEIKIFSVKQKLREFIASEPVQTEMFRKFFMKKKII